MGVVDFVRFVVDCYVVCYGFVVLFVFRFVYCIWVFVIKDGWMMYVIERIML